MKRLLIQTTVLVLFAFSASAAYSEDYYWQCSLPGCTAQPDLRKAAEQLLTLQNFNWQSFGFMGCTFVRQDYGYCSYSHPGGVYQPQANRYGTTCPPDQTYNAETGGCDAPEPDKCAELANTSFPFSKSGAAGDGYVSLSADRKFGVASQSACHSGCVANTADQKCTTRVTGSYFCQGTGYYTGAECGSGGSAEVEQSPVPDYPEPETILEDKPCIPVYNADGSTTCTSEKSVEKEGQHCGMFNGERLCVDAQPSKNQVDIQTDTKVQTNPDGSKTTTKTDTATATKCNGTACPTKTTVTTTTTHTDSAGNKTGTTGTCKGPDCPDQQGNPDADGDGFGDCIGGKCEQGSSVGGEGCDVDLACEGDPIQCAILRKSKEQQCFAEEQADFEGHKDDIENLVQGDKFELDEGGDDIDVPGLINKGTRFLPASCPPDETVNLITAGGHTFKFTYEPLCRAATDLGNLFVAFALVFAALYVGRSVGGS
ncbi:virulence factor TspB C-terminal domain-related protein [Pseudomonas sp. S9]|uniref:virulence factor TspB C-terminal domain-related protein n=1 Tax=Pseudomonas sp. S9 TaxID=686578 RepID=UPI0002557269|nr:virulence factor TspB C-terminal domain-related protein [Pseudomonas sp. S9]